MHVYQFMLFVEFNCVKILHFNVFQLKNSIK